MSSNAQFQTISATLITLSPNSVVEIATLPNYVGSIVQYASGGSAFINGVSLSGGALLNQHPLNLTPFRGSYFLTSAGATTSVSVIRFFT